MIKGNEMEPKVYITQDNNKNYSPAHRYGTPSFATNLEYSSILNSEDNVKISIEMEKVAEEYNPDIDYILPSGDVIVAAMLIHEVLALHGKVTVLKWQNRDRIYTPIVLKD